MVLSLSPEDSDARTTPHPPRAGKDRFQAGLGGPPWAQPAGAASALLLRAGLALGGSVQPTGWQYHRDPGNVGTRATLALVCGGRTFPEVGKGEGEEDEPHPFCQALTLKLYPPLLPR